MKASEAKLLTFLKNSPQFIIPIYQRTYSWTEKECRQLWHDVLRAGQSDDIAVHFIGSIVYIEQGLSSVSSQSPLLVIDGQQRLTSATLLLAALAEALGDAEPVEGFSAKKISNYYLLNPLEDGDQRFKLLLSKNDRKTLTAIVSGQEEPEHVSLRVKENHRLFKELLGGGDDVVEQVCCGLSKLVVVDLALSREHDNPQLIFESMNSTGRELSQADLIRNFVLMDLEPRLQTELYEQFWHPMENGFGQGAYSDHFDGFMRHYLTVKTGDIPRIGDVYDAYKAYARKSTSCGRTIEDLVREVREYARFYCAMALGREDDSRLKEAFQDLRELRVDVAYPFLLELYADYHADQLSAEEFVEIIRLVEAYVFRRSICAIPTNSLNKTFSTFVRSIQKDHYLESVTAHFLTMRSYRRFPKDDEFIESMQVRDLYNFRNRSYWLRRFENFGRKERVQVDDYTIEHIMPQNEALSPAWVADLGDNWKEVHERWLHTLGNLTLTGYNSEYSDRPFAEKRDMEKGFRHSPLKVNEGLGAVETWNDKAIKERAVRLAKQAAHVWKAPSLTTEALAKYLEEPVESAQYTIDDHPHLARDDIGAIFNAFRREVLALDPCVTEEFLKRYVAYKAETNFVDVVPQKKGLVLYINIDPPEVSDPRGLINDVSELGRWGNGNSQVRLSRAEDITYAVGLVRQALERQLGGTEAE